MRSEEQAKKEAPGLRIGSTTWKWPAIWPYDQSFFIPTLQVNAIEKQTQMQGMTSMLTGVAQAPGTEAAAADSIPEFDPLTYWGEEQVDTETGLDPEAKEKLAEHYSFYLKDGMSVLELGAAEDSYLPKDLKLSRHVGVGACQVAMDKNPALSETMVVNLNKVIPERDVDSDELRVLAQDPFDVIILANTVNYLTDPREVFRSAWYLLKPGGKMIVPFASKEAVKANFEDAATKSWTNYNDDQHMWMTGSFFQFSAGEGWENVLGFDISPESAGEIDKGGISIMKKGKRNNMFVVQATKGFQYDAIDEKNLEQSIGSLCWMLPVLEDRDKKLVVPRLARTYEKAESEDIKAAIGRNIQNLPAVYEALTKMDQYAFTFSMQAQMAADLVADPSFTASEDQILALKQGLGLRTPSEEFWIPVGQTTADMDVEDKINLLAYLVPSFGSGDPSEEDALQAFVTGLKPTFALIRSKCPDLPESDVQLLGTELLAIEVSKARRSSRNEFATWINTLTEQEMRDILSARKTVKIKATEEKQEFINARENDKKRLEDLKERMDEQMIQAREERSLYFNPQTEKMEMFENPNEKKGGIMGMLPFGS